MACCCYTKLNELLKTDLAEPCVLWKLQEQSPNLNNHSTFLGVFDFILWILILPGLRKVPCFVDVEAARSYLLDSYGDLYRNCPHLVRNIKLKEQCSGNVWCSIVQKTQHDTLTELLPFFKTSRQE